MIDLDEKVEKQLPETVRIIRTFFGKKKKESEEVEQDGRNTVA